MCLRVLLGVVVGGCTTAIDPTYVDTNYLLTGKYAVYEINRENLKGNIYERATTNRHDTHDSSI